MKCIQVMGGGASWERCLSGAVKIIWLWGQAESTWTTMINLCEFQASLDDIERFLSKKLNRTDLTRPPPTPLDPHTLSQQLTAPPGPVESLKKAVLITHCWDESSLRRGGFTLAHCSRIQSVTVGKYWWQACETAGPPAPAERDGC